MTIINMWLSHWAWGDSSCFHHYMGIPTVTLAPTKIWFPLQHRCASMTSTYISLVWTSLPPTHRSQKQPPYPGHQWCFHRDSWVKASGPTIPWGFCRSEIFGVLCRDLTLPVSTALLKLYCFLYVHMCLRVRMTEGHLPSFTSDNASCVSELPTDRRTWKRFRFICTLVFRGPSPWLCSWEGEQKGAKVVTT